jgi:hypothetical protein
VLISTQMTENYTNFFNNPADDLAEDMPGTVGELSKKLALELQQSKSNSRFNAQLLLAGFLGLLRVSSVDDLLDGKGFFNSGSAGLMKQEKQENEDCEDCEDVPVAE